MFLIATCFPVIFYNHLRSYVFLNGCIDVNMNTACNFCGYRAYEEVKVKQAWFASKGLLYCMWFHLSLFCVNNFLCFVFFRGCCKGLERKGKWTSSAWARTWANYWSTFSLQLRRLREDIYRCGCFEEAFSHPRREAICLPLRWLWKGNESVSSDPRAHKCTYVC